MKPSPISAFIFATLLAAAAVAAKAQTPEIAMTPAARQFNQTELTWLTDLPKALSKAKAEGKSVLLLFHGSDWCLPCVEMQRQVFASQEFVQYARRALISRGRGFPTKIHARRRVKAKQPRAEGQIQLEPGTWHPKQMSKS